MLGKNLNLKFYSNMFKPKFDLNIEEFFHEYNLSNYDWLEAN